MSLTCPYRQYEKEKIPNILRMLAELPLLEFELLFLYDVATINSGKGAMRELNSPGITRVPHPINLYAPGILPLWRMNRIIFLLMSKPYIRILIVNVPKYGSYLKFPRM